MRSFFIIVLFACIHLPSFAQYYYKDIIGGRETADLVKTYQANKVQKVVLNSYDANNTQNTDFYVEQQLTNSTMRTITRSNVTNESVLTSYLEGSNVVKTVDSSDAVVSTTSYTNNSKGQLISTVSFSSDSSNTANESEQHIWEYANGIPSRMLRIKNVGDTTFVLFKTDDKGNVIEEQETHKGVKTEPVYYYYDANNRITDIVRFNKRANRLLPEYMFEYSPTNQVVQQITVPANNSEYLIWRYQYNDKGLKVKEAVYDKQKKLNGSITYEYSFGN